MTSDQVGAGGVEPDPTEPVIRDRRRIDPQTGAVRPEFRDAGAGDASDPSSIDPGEIDPELANAVGEVFADDLQTAQAEAAERLEDLQRLQAEYVNYRKRVDRDRSVAHDLAIVELVEALIPVLDEIELARQHGELGEGPFAAISEKLEQTLGRFGAARYGAVGEAFDPTIHEALMHSTSPDVTTTSVVTVLQPGYRVNDRILRAARVAVADPE